MKPATIRKNASDVWKKFPDFLQIAVVLLALPIGILLARDYVNGGSKTGTDIASIEANVLEIKKNTDTLVNEMQFFKAMAIKATADNEAQAREIDDLWSGHKLNADSIESLKKLHDTHEAQIDLLWKRTGATPLGAFDGPTIGPMGQ